MGELGGLALIKNAVNQGRDCVDVIVQRLGNQAVRDTEEDLWDVVIVGAGPAGISASLRAAEHGLKALTLERESVGGTVSKYPRQKLVMTSPVEFPLHGRFSKTTLSKEDLLRFLGEDHAAHRSEYSYRRSVEALQEAKTMGLFAFARSEANTARAPWCWPWAGQARRANLGSRAKTFRMFSTG